MGPRVPPAARGCPRGSWAPPWHLEPEDGSGILINQVKDEGIRNAAGTANLLTVPLDPSTAKTYSGTFVASETNSKVWVYSTDEITSVDNLSVRLADPDRSVNNNGLIIEGQPTRVPVATGAELVKFTGFSHNDYLYNPSFNTPTADTYFVWWTEDSQGDKNQLYLGDGTYGGTNPAGGLFCWTYGGYLKSYWGGLYNPFLVPAGMKQVWLILRGTTLEAWVNGEMVAYWDGRSPLTATHLTVGNGYYYGFSDGLALLRIGAGAPSADQIAKSYRDEKALFQTGAACTLYGASDLVKALDHDSMTGLDHIGTGDGRSVFKDLLRVDQDTNPITKALAAHDGWVIEA